MNDREKMQVLYEGILGDTPLAPTTAKGTIKGIGSGIKSGVKALGSKMAGDRDVNIGQEIVKGYDTTRDATIRSGVLDQIKKLVIDLYDDLKAMTEKSTIEDVLASLEEENPEMVQVLREIPRQLWKIPAQPEPAGGGTAPAAPAKGAL